MEADANLEKEEACQGKHDVLTDEWFTVMKSGKKATKRRRMDETKVH